MDFGRLESVDDVRFALPPLVGAMRSEPRAGVPVIRAGTPAWSSRLFARKVYPKGTASGDFLAHYAKRFLAIELNATFHRVPPERTIDGWRDATPDAFRFCPKIHKTVVEKLDAEGAKRFAEIMSRFGARLGPMLLQLPPMFAPGRIDELVSMLDAMEGYAVAVELRHKKWFAEGRLIDAAARALGDRGAIAVMTDTAGRRDASHGTLTARSAFVRFQGNELHPSDAERIQAWAERFAAMGAAGVEEVYFFVHQPDDTLAPETLEMLEQRVALVLAANEPNAQLL